MGRTVAPGTMVELPRSGSAGIPWFVWCAAAAITSVTLGLHWDVSWHRSIGRDTFWAPPHIAIYAGGLFAGVSCGYLILRTTFAGAGEMAARSVNVFGLQGPVGAFIAAWGGATMLTAAPFDNWWHGAYGLDVKIMSPPHMVLLLGVQTIAVGSLLLVIGHMNRCADDTANDPSAAQFRAFQRLALYLGGMMLVTWMFFMMEYTSPTRLHAAVSYGAMSVAVPFWLALMRACSRHRWAATIVALIYLGTGIGLILVLPLFPAQPKLGPVFYQVTHLVPPPFPVLLVAPAFALDVLWGRWRARSKGLLSLASGALFVATLLAVEWSFASFLRSHGAQNRFFGGIYHGYWERPGRRIEFDNPLDGWRTLYRMAEIVGIATLSTRVGLGLGGWMRGVKR